MSGSLEPSRSSVVETLSRAPTRFPSKTARALAAVRDQALVEEASILAEAYLTDKKVQLIGDVGKTTIDEVADLQRYATAVAGADPMLNDSLQQIVDITRMAQVQKLQRFARDL